MNSASLQPIFADVNALLVCEFDVPVPLRLPVEEQVERVMTTSRVVQCNQNMAELCRYPQRAELYGKSLRDVIVHSRDFDPEVILSGMRSRLTMAARHAYHYEGFKAQWILGEDVRDYTVSYHGLIRNGCLERLVILNRDETERRRQEYLVFDIAQHLNTEGGDFFSRLAEQLASYLNVDGVLIGEIIDIEHPRDAVRTLAYWLDGEFQPTMDYLLEGTPCAEVQGREICVFPQGVARQFPDDEILAESEIDSYMGVPLYGESWRQIGLIALMNRQPFKDETIARSLLTIFSVRAAAELERVQSERARVTREVRQHVFFDNAPHGLYVAEVDPPMPLNLSVPEQVRWLLQNAHFSECNNAFAHLLGYQNPEDLVGKRFDQTNSQYDLAGSLRRFIDYDYRLDEQAIKGSFPDGKDVWFAYTISAVIENGLLKQLLAVVSDITERMLYTRQMEHRARHDSLTGLPNRAFLIETLEQRIQDRSKPFALFLIDLDGFKEVNDTLGHEMGDYLLKEIGPRLSSIVAPYQGMVARLGGDEFAVLLPESSDYNKVRAIAEEVVAAIKRPFKVHELDLMIGGSLGIALYPEQGDSVSSLMRCADIAMYQAKRHSRQVELYRSDQDHYTVRRLALMMEIRQAIGNNELELMYQPIINLTDGRVIGFEALLRWRHPQHGVLPPVEFIPLIELTEMMEPMTWWVLETATAELCRWRERGWDFHLAVNISTRNIADSHFAERVKQLLTQRQLDGQSLTMEITESALMADPEQARRVLLSLAQVGVRFSIDDYGTGYSSLAYLKSLPIHTLKIDRTFICHMLGSSQDRIIVNSTVQLAHNLGLKVTAEGIESNALLVELCNMGCDCGQGFFVSRPLSPHDLAEWVRLHERFRREGSSREEYSVHWGEGI